MTSKRRKGRLTKEDEALWRDVAKTVRRHKPDDTVPEEPEPDTFDDLVKSPVVPTTASAPSPSLISTPPLRRPKPSALTAGDLTPLDKRAGQRLKRGQWPIDARLDLHGLTRDKAHLTLMDFIDRAWASRLRCVLVITGKGLRAEDGVGVLRASLEGWLNSSDLRRRIVSYTPAQPKDGGSGAFYILLKRQK